MTENQGEQSLLLQAAQYGNDELLTDLLSGEFVQQLDCRDRRGRSALHFASANKNAKCLELLLRAGADVNACSNREDGSQTPLHIASMAGNVDACRLLTTAGGDLLATNTAQYTPLEVAQMANEQGVARVLLEAMEERQRKLDDLSSRVDAACVRGDITALDLALAEAQTVNVLEDVLNGKADDYSPLYRACERGHKSVVEALLKREVGGRIHPVTFYSPLYIAVYAGHHEIVSLLLSRFPDLVQVSTVEKWLPVHAAAHVGDANMVKILLDFNYPNYVKQKFYDRSGYWCWQSAFDVNEPDGDCRTPLYIACSEGHADAVRILLSHTVTAREADAAADNVDEATEATETYEDVMHTVKEPADSGSENEGLDTLKKARLKLNTKETTTTTPNVKIIRPVAVDVYDASGHTPLHMAVMKRHLDIVKLLLEAGADVNLPLALTDDDLIRMQAEEVQCSGSGALIEACNHGDISLVDLLLDRGAVDQDNKALAVCVKSRHDAIACKLLVRHTFADPEFRVNKKCLDVESIQYLSKGRSVAPSALCPGCPVMLSWHSGMLEAIQERWLLEAALQLNPKLRTASSFSSSIVLSAITRIDVAKNRLTELPLAVFQLASLRILNAANNLIENLPNSVVQETPKRKNESSTSTSSSTWNCPVLEELHLEHNRLESLPKIIFELPNLIGLDVSNNSLTSLPSNFWFTPKLKDVNVSGNQLRFLPTIERESRRNISVTESGIEQDFLLGATTPGSDEHARTSSTTAASGSSPTVSVKSSNDLTTASTSVGGGDLDAEECSSVGSFRLFRQDDRLSYQELKRHNLWQKSVGLSRQYDDDDGVSDSKETTKSCLTSLNLSNNLFERIPDGLPCLAPSLSRLTMAHNRLSEIGSVNVFPSRLKHLDLSNNRITAWFGSPINYDGCAASIIGVGIAAGGNRRTTRSPVIGSRSASAVRNRSLSVARNQSDTTFSIATTCCAHRRHVRLANLRTLVLANNILEYVQLTTVTPPSTPATLSHRDRDRRSSTSSSRRSSSMARKSLSDYPASMQSNQPPANRQALVFPNLSMLDLSSNILRFIPPEISELNGLSVLNLSNNSLINYLPAEMGLLSRLWNLNLNGCNMSEPLKTMLDSKRYKTMDIIGYLKSVLEDSRPYARMKLMIVGVQGIGKTSLLEQLRQEGSAASKKSNDGWAKRMGHKNINQKTNKGVNISTVGVDVGDWIYEPKRIKNQPSFGQVTFRTWDFGGQREYYSTHQYFLSKRSLYLAVWRVTDGEAGVNEITQWLVNIQARAPNAPVIIVGTHYDEVLNNSKKFPQSFVEDLQRQIRERFVAVQDADKKGLPRVIDSVIVSCKSRFNIRVLCDLIYRCAYELRLPGTKERMLEQKIPASYLALEEIVTTMAYERRAQGKDCVLTTEQYRTQVQELMRKNFGKPFRDNAELNQATAFLHDNGVCLHYDDATLKDMYFLDPQWLCDILAHVITIREINPFAKNGLMKTDDLKILFKSSAFAPANIRNYLLSLLQKFEVGLSWDNRTLLIPSLLPDEYQLRAGYPGCEVKIPVRSKGWIVKIGKSSTTAADGSSNTNMPAIYLKHGQELPLFEIHQLHSTDVGGGGGEKNAESNSTNDDDNENKKAKFVPLFTLNRPKKTVEELAAEYYVSRTVKDDSTIRRLYLMAYFPSGFWSRLITRILGDETIPVLFDQVFKFSGDVSNRDDKKLHRILEANRAEWMLWQTGMEIQFMGQTLFSLKEFLPLAEVRDINYKEIKFKYRQDNNWTILDAELSSILELFMPDSSLSLRYQGDDGKAKLVTMETDAQVMTKLLSIIIDTLDTLLEDWYPTLGTRFVHTSEGKYLVTRLVPCTNCLTLFGKPDVQATQDDSWTVLSLRGSGGNAATKKDEETATTKANEDGRLAKSKTFDNANVLGERIRRPSNSSQDSGMAESCGDNSSHIVGVRSTSLTEFGAGAGSRSSMANTSNDKIAYTFTVEECILAAHDAVVPKCPMHGSLPLSLIAPDTVFLDLGPSFLIVPEQVKRGKMLGRGAFGFVFKANVKLKGQNQSMDVALKMLQPVDPGFGAKPSAVTAFKAAYAKWQRDPTQYACRAYCTARQELNVLLNLKHANVVPFLGVSPRPLSIALGLAPLGSLNTLLQNYRRSGARLNLSVVQETAAQVSKALEYLHQQHVIYRDLKSENVLVWQFPPPFSQLTTVEVKLGDYGISRNVLPTGGAKGFGGTEGFMAPEIMRYNGEEEYTEKVDCFSFGMFLYELLSLKLPFEGQEQVKEYLLDGGRPTLTAKELLYPCNILDLMVVCWSQQPAERPSSSQLVSVTTSPEFSHLLDVVSLSDSDSAVIAGDAFIVEEGNQFDEAANVFEGETWLSRADGQVSILSCNQHGWLDYKVKQNVAVNDDSFITSLCLVDDTIWLGERTGVVRIFCARTYSEMHSFSLAPYILPNENSPKHQFILPASEIIYLANCRSVLITVSQPGALLVCPVANALCGGGTNPPVSASIRSAHGEINCTCALPQQDRTMNAWCGHSSGYISIYEVDASSIFQLAVINHYNPVFDGLEVSRLVSSSMSGRYVWSYVYPGCTLYQWDASERAIIAKLDCSKIAPCSESINTINIDERLSPGRCQVTALCLVEKEDGPQLYIGTTWGVVIVAEADQLRPCTAFRPHVEEIRLIMAISQQKRAVLSTPLSRMRPTCSSSIGLGTGGSSQSQQRTSEVNILNAAAAVNSPKSNPLAKRDSGNNINNNGKRPSYENRKADVSSASSFLHTPRMEAFNAASGHNGTFLITVGKGYRALMQRFLDNFKEDGEVLESRKKDIFAVLWRTDDWVNF